MKRSMSKSFGHSEKKIRLLKEALLFISLFFTKSMHLFMRERTSVNNYFDIIIPSLFSYRKAKDSFSPNFMQNKVYIVEFASFIHIF